MRKFRFTYLMLALVSLVTMSSCEKPAPLPDEETVAVTYSALDGCWALSLLQGKPIAEHTYLYIEFFRTKRRYSMWDNMDSMYGTETTGTFAISDEEGTYILSGTYDYGVGVWNNKYQVKLMSENRMVWYSMGQNHEVMEFERIDQIPELK